MKRWAWGLGAVLALGLALVLLWPKGSTPGRRAGGSSPSNQAGGTGWASAPGEAGTLEAPESSARGSLRGTVLSLLGQPVPGVSILVLPVPEGGSSWSTVLCQRNGGGPLFRPDIDCVLRDRMLEDVLEEAREPEPEPARTKSDARGTFELGGLPEGVYEVWAEAPHGVAVQRVSTGTGEVRLVLEQGITPRGDILGEDEAPLAGARVLLLPVALVRRLETVSGADGRYAFGRVPRGAYWVLAWREGLLPDADELDALEDREAPLMLMTPYTLVGRVVRAGRGVADARVRALGFRYEQSTLTDGQGGFRFEGVRLGSYTLEATHGSESALGSAILETGEEQGPALLELHPCAVLEGRVTVGSDLPLAEADVSFHRYGDEDYMRSTRSDARGQYRFDCLAPGEFAASVQAKGFQVHSVQGGARLEAGETRRLDWKLSEAVPLEGVVVDAEERPVPGAKLLAYWAEEAGRASEGEEHSSVAAALAGEDGRFSFDGLSPGTYSLEISASEEFEPWSGEVRAPLTRARFVLKRARPAPGVIIGTVVDEQGRPLEGIAVEAQQPSTLEQLPPVRTDGLGQFRLQRLPLGPWRVIASHEGMEQDGQVRATADVELQGPDPVRVHLRLGVGLTLSGFVVDEQGAPVPSASLTAYRKTPATENMPGGILLGGTVDADAAGRFVLRHLASGEYELTVSAMADDALLRPAQLTVRAGDTGVRVVLGAMRQARGRVVLSDGSPVPAFVVNGNAHAEPGGRFSLPFEPPGPLTLLVAAEGLAPTLRQFEVEADTDTVLPDVVLVRGRPVRGRVVDATTGRPVGEAAVTPLDLFLRGELLVDETSGRVWTQADGRFELPAVEPGAVLTVDHDGYLPARMPVPQGPEEVLIRMQPFLQKEPEPEP